MNNNKEFDRSIAFTFYKEWKEDANTIEEDYGAEGKAKFYDAIIDYALFEIEPEMKPPIKYFWNSIKEKIDASQSHRARGFSKENTELTQQIIQFKQDNPEASQREIAEALECSIGKVNKVLKGLTSPSTATSSSTATVTSTSTTVNVNVNAHDSQRKKRGVEDLSLEETIDLLQSIANKVPYAELMKKYNLARIDKDAINEHYKSLSFKPKQVEVEYYAPEPRQNTNARRALADIEDEACDEDDEI